METETETVPDVKFQALVAKLLQKYKDGQIMKVWQVNHIKKFCAPRLNLVFSINSISLLIHVMNRQLSCYGV
jgi:hypothetical protein